MKTWFVSRHPGALQWMQRNNIAFDEHVAHLEPEIVAQGDKVIGSLPVNLAAQIQERGAEYWNLSLIIPASARGQELTADELETFNAKLEQYQVALLKAAPQSSVRANASTPAKPDIQAVIDTSAWLDDVFKLHAWQESGAQRNLNRYLDLAFQAPKQAASLRSELKKVAELGKQAHQLAIELNTILTTQSAEAAEQFIKEGKHHWRIKRHLNIQFKKRLTKKPKYTKTRYQPKLPLVQLHNGQHPQAVRNLKPSQHWSIYIDETGSEFGVDFSESPEHQIGKIIALALPQGNKLPPLKQAIHNTEVTVTKVEELIAAVVQSKAGVFGASLDGVLEAHSWMAAMNQFIRLLLLMLPMNLKSHTRVDIFIEERGQYGVDEDGRSEQLEALTEAIESELKSTAPEIFANLHLDLQFMKKEHPFNGYVDAVANCWGSSTKARRALLKRTRWLGHCLLEKGNLSEIEQLYVAINQGQMTAEDWFKLCDFAAFEPQHSIFNNLLDELGKKSQSSPTLWASYLHYVQYRIGTKQYNAGNLSRALNWLDGYKANQTLPPLLELQLVSARLAAINHHGQEDLNLAKQAIALINQLQDEAPEAVCHTLLRLAISATHSFDFTSLQPLLEKWLTYPIGVAGLANYAKLHSTLGQLLAFQGQAAASVEHFEQATSLFNQLSDPVQAAREVQQTQTYQAICMMDGQHLHAVSFTQSLLENKDFNGATSERFNHYLLLRLLTHFPELASEREHYLAKQQNWQTGEGHPWMLINAYRGWLLVESGELEMAKEYFEQAITECADSDNGAILQWMSKVLWALAGGLGCKLAEPTIEANLALYPEHLLAELAHPQLEHQQRISLLAQMLPFNFH